MCPVNAAFQKIFSRMSETMKDYSTFKYEATFFFMMKQYVPACNSMYFVSVTAVCTERRRKKKKYAIWICDFTLKACLSEKLTLTPSLLKMHPEMHQTTIVF